MSSLFDSGVNNANFLDETDIQDNTVEIAKNTFYTKTEIDTNIYTKTEIDTNHYDKTHFDGSFSFLEASIQTGIAGISNVDLQPLLDDINAVESDVADLSNVVNQNITDISDISGIVSQNTNDISENTGDITNINTYMDLDFGRLTMSRVEQNKNRIYIPFYQYPDFAQVQSSQFVDDLQDLLDLADENPNIPIIATINPQNGPGTVEDLQYTKFFKRLRGHNIDVNGYIYSGGRSDDPNSDGTGLIPTTPIIGTEKGYLRDPENFRADLLEWFEYYGEYITGIFIDEFPFFGWEGDPNTNLTFPKDICGNDSPWNSFTTQGEVNAYTNQLFREHYNLLYRTVKTESRRVLNRFLTVVANPGVASEPIYDNSIFEHNGDATKIIFDLIMDWENSSYPNFTTIENAEYLGSIKHYNKSSRIAVVHSQASFDRTNFKKLLKYYGSVYITSDVLPNPFDNLNQSYITEMAEVINENSRTEKLQTEKLDISGGVAYNLDISNDLTVNGITSLNSFTEIDYGLKTSFFSNKIQIFGNTSDPLFELIQNTTNKDSRLSIGQTANGGVDIKYDDKFFKLTDPFFGNVDFFVYDLCNNITTINGDLVVSGDISGVNTGGGGGGGGFNGGTVANDTTFESDVSINGVLTVDDISYNNQLVIRDSGTSNFTRIDSSGITISKNADSSLPEIQFLNNNISGNLASNMVIDCAGNDSISIRDRQNNTNIVSFNKDDNIFYNGATEVHSKLSCGNRVNDVASNELLRAFNICATNATIRMSRYGSAPAIEWRVFSTTDPDTANLDAFVDMYVLSTDEWNLRFRDPNVNPIVASRTEVNLFNTTVNTTSQQSGYNLTVNGSAYASGSFVSGSDSRIKRDIVDISENEVRNIMKNIQTKKYKYSDDFRKSRNMEDDPETIGFIAQEIKELIPEAVEVDDFKTDYRTGEYTIDASGQQEEIRETLEIPEFHFLKKDRIFAVGMEAIKYNMKDIELLKQENEMLKKEILDLKDLIRG